MDRITKDKPNFFHSLKVETDRRIRSWWNTRRDSEGKAIESPEDLTLLYCLLKEYQAFVDAQVCLLGDKILAKMEEKNTNKIPLPEYGFTLEYDEEARWLVERDLSREEWVKWDYDCNQEYLKKKEEEKK
jgi:hypothetical protein